MALPSHSDRGLDVDAAARGLAELEFDARVALPEAQERFKRAEAKIADLMEECELAAEQGRLVGMDAERYRQALEQIADPDWASVYPPDVFKETKRIARKALDG